MAYVVFTNVHSDIEVRQIACTEGTVIPLDGSLGNAEDPLLQYFTAVEEALALRLSCGVTGESYWQSFALYFDC
jgi:hypothetical protein